MIVEGRSSETTGEDSDGMFLERLMDDDRWKMLDEGSLISTSRGGMLMGSIMSGSFTKAKGTNRGEVDSLRLASNWRTVAREERKFARRGKRWV